MHGAPVLVCTEDETGFALGADRTPTATPVRTKNGCPCADGKFMKLSDSVGGARDRSVQDVFSDGLGVGCSSIEVIGGGEARWRADAHGFEQRVEAKVVDMRWRHRAGFEIDDDLAGSESIGTAECEI